MKFETATLEELANSLDELFMDLADLKEQNEAIGDMIAKRDSMNLLMVKHVEKIAREKEVLLMHLGLDSLKTKQLDEERKKAEAEAEEKKLRELYEKLKMKFEK